MVVTPKRRWKIGAFVWLRPYSRKAQIAPRNPWRNFGGSPQRGVVLYGFQHNGFMCLSIFRGQIGNLWISFHFHHWQMLGSHPKVSTYIIGKKKTVKVSGKSELQLPSSNETMQLNIYKWRFFHHGFHRNIPKLHGGFFQPQRATKHPACRRLRGLQFQGLFLVEFPPSNHGAAEPWRLERPMICTWKGQPEREENRMLPAKKNENRKPQNHQTSYARFYFQC